MTTPPASEDELLQRAYALAGRTIGQVARQAGVALPAEARRGKGAVGQLLERVLGATATSRPLPDFPALGVEMKSLPVNADGRPQQSTYVCTAPLRSSVCAFDDSWVCKKLRRVLWIPIVDAPQPKERLIASPMLWSPDEEERAVLAADWHELTDLLWSGELWQVDARRGKALQLRPKGAKGSDTTWALSDDGEWVRAQPKGFYLRPSFTAGLLRKHYRMPGDDVR